MYNITRGGNNKLVGVGTQLNSDLITGAGNLTAFNDMLEFSAGIAKSCITNTEFGTGYTGWTQVRDTGIYADSATGSNQDFGSCANVISAVHTCVGIVTTLAAGGSVTQHIQVTMVKVLQLKIILHSLLVLVQSLRVHTLETALILSVTALV